MKHIFIALFILFTYSCKKQEYKEFDVEITYLNGDKERLIAYCQYPPRLERNQCVWVGEYRCGVRSVYILSTK